MLIILEKIGWGMLALTGFVGGIIGLALPVIPQVPFFLLALHSLSCRPASIAGSRVATGISAWSFQYWKNSIPSAKPKSAY